HGLPFTRSLPAGACRLPLHDAVASSQPLAGAVFRISGTTLSGNPFTTESPDTGDDGYTCAAPVPFGTYTVQEITPPFGYTADDSNPSDPILMNTPGQCPSAASTPIQA